MEGIGFNEWRHVFKLDPDKELTDEELDAVCMSGTDAIMVGGSSGVTYENTVDLMSRIRRYEVPCVLEVSSLDAAVPGFDGYLVPMVLNTDKPEWLIGHHIEGIKEYGSFIPWDKTAAEGYIILNADATAAKLTEANTNLDAADVAARVRLAARLLKLPIVYLEYSGRFGDMELVKRAAAAAGGARVFYGGGIDSAEKARQAAEVVHTVVVGNIVYADLQKALATVAAVKENAAV
ncbi:heptaprenylglyceryl phosphate synthase [Paenibacillus protaetiae]|uniref:Heptaprenylglyceryl phosphate synthase n=1 Tax=Paenibacillus protaetiae TaxID=2509456 RepID=A0A4P6EYA2_9BACL|nr:heptaprenylglyceryl phosphate synthase [Paenibacillus protaetiae]QAY67816.1 heptaprenylglyceryl phosphate synthase [Paenibacillus protaetiae]